MGGWGLVIQMRVMINRSNFDEYFFGVNYNVCL